jgi:NADH pyrophosphatase NudC (nudix superfamily)
MEIKSRFISEGKEVNVTYHDTDSFDHLLDKKVTQVYGICFCNNKLLVVYNKKKDMWTPAGGSLEKGETYEECLKREVQEESNMKVTASKPVGYQEVDWNEKNFFQLRYVCKVEPCGDFVSDPCGDVTEIKLIDPRDYKQYFDWGEIGDRIIKRALEILDNV